MARRATRVRLAVGLLLVGFGLPAVAGNCLEEAKPADYPVPPLLPGRLLFLQRSTNFHTVIYDARVRADGTLDPQLPVDAYWLRYRSEGVERMELRWLERTFAYGVSSEPLDGATGFRVSLAALPERPGQLSLGPDGKAALIVEVAGRPARLEYIYVEADDSGLVPRVHFVDLCGTRLDGGESVRERITPG